MKAVILAAGLSSRIRQVTNGLPKCLLRFGDRTILDYQLDSLFDAGITEAAVVVGYGKEHIVHHIAHCHPEKLNSIRFIVNPQFASTNNIASLWLTRDWVGDSDFLCLNADVLYHPRILLPAVASRDSISVIVDPEFREETMKVVIANGQVLAMKKGIPREQFSGTYIGITKFSRRIKASLFAAIEDLVRAGETGVFFQIAVERLIAAGVRVGYTTTKGLPWAEVDDADDLCFALNTVYPQLKSAGLAAKQSCWPPQHQPYSDLVLAH